MSDRLRFLLLNQAFYPDVVSTAQHLADLALGLVGQGHQVTVVASRRGYDHPETKFPAKEVWRGIRIYRIGSTGFGKSAKWRRVVDFGAFIAFCALRLARLPRHDVVVALTSPPLISFLGAWLAKLRRSRFCYWVMDFNPDEAIAAGWLQPGSLAARILDAMSRFSLRQAARIIALDRFMRDRIAAKGISPEKITVIPPWSHDGQVQFDPAGAAQFRHAHGLDGKFVVMYSGNHSPCHPLDTLLNAARQLGGNARVAFCFVGGGSEFRRIQLLSDQEKLSNVKCLPYQPLSELSASLSAADLQVVVMGEPFVGLVHPCKIYNILSIAAPVLYIGPRPSHLSEILDSANAQLNSITVRHGEDVRVARQIERMSEERRLSIYREPAPIRSQFSKEKLLPALIGALMD